MIRADSTLEPAIPAPTPPRLVSGVLPATSGALLGVIAGGLCWWAAGPTLGLFFGGVLLTPLIIPPLVAAEITLPRQHATAAGVVFGISAIWLAAILAPHPPAEPIPSLFEWLQCTAVLASFALALVGMTAAMSRARLPASLASFFTLVIAAAWLTWPVWLSPALPGHDDLVRALALPHPLIAINAVLHQLGLWTQQPLAYHLTALNHDVALPMPGGIGWAVGIHGVLGAGLLTCSCWRRMSAIAEPIVGHH